MCEDYPCCGHEAGDCRGNLYDTDANIKWRVHRNLAYGDSDWGLDDLDY
jgi:hypothetical protein